MKRIALLIVIAFGCRKERIPAMYQGMELSCGSVDYSVATCVGGGRIFKCVDHSRGCGTGPWDCATYEGPL